MSVCPVFAQGLCQRPSTPHIRFFCSHSLSKKIEIAFSGEHTSRLRVEISFRRRGRLTISTDALGVASTPSRVRMPSCHLSDHDVSTSTSSESKFYGGRRRTMPFSGAYMISREREHILRSSRGAFTTSSLFLR